MRIGYMRISTQEWTPMRVDVTKDELDVEKVFIDKTSINSNSKDRPELEKLITFAREGDTVVVENISSFAVNTKDFLSLIKRLTEKNVVFISKEEGIDTDTDTGRHILKVLEKMVELERNHTRQRQAEGIAAAKASGKYNGRKTLEVSEDAFAEQYKAWKSGETSPIFAAKKLGMSRATFYRYAEEYEKKNGIDPAAEAESAFAEQYRLWRNGETSVTFAARKLGITRPTFYRRVEEYEAKHGITPSDESADTSAD